MKALYERDNFGIMGEVRITTYKAGTLEKLRVTDWMKNLVVSSDGYGRNILARLLTGDATYSGEITHADMGTGSTAPADGDTDLETGVARAQVGSAAISNNIVTLRFFFSDATLPDGTYNELGTFIDGSSSVGTGQLFNRLVFGTPYVKAAGEDSSVEVKFTLSSS